MVKHFLVLLLALTVLAVHAQDQSGFISIDCGIADNASYIDGTTGINYVSDVDYIDTGVSKSISPLYKTNGLEQQLSNVRSFPQGTKNCYTLTPPKVSGTKYLVRARFMYGNYDNKNEVPNFDLHIGVNYWDTVEFKDVSRRVTKEILHVPSSNYTYVCLVNTGLGTPFISVLELRLIKDKIYNTTPPRSLALFKRFDMKAYEKDEVIRYEDDIFDRVWDSSFLEYGMTELNTSLDIGSKYQNNFTLPSVVMRTAITPQNASDPIKFNWKPVVPRTKYYMYFHFADLQSTQYREFNIILNDVLWYGPFQPRFLATTTISSSGPETAEWFNFSFSKTVNSTLLPILNAFEVYILKDFSNTQTDQDDVDAIKSIKSVYGVKKNWQGDPCSPQAYSWEGLKCFYDSFDPPRIISLNLSLSGLTGKISPSLVNLKMLQSLDLSNNSLTGEVPDFLSQLEKLYVLNLAGNNLTGAVPAGLIKRSKNGLLSLSMDSNLCTLESCDTTYPKKKKKNMVIPIVIASVAAVLVLSIAFAIVWMFIRKGRKSQQRQEAIAGSNITRDAPFKAKQQQFTFSEVSMITKEFQRVLGKGGFGTVYHGYLEDTQVAVKMLSPSSGQGYKQFKAEAELLMRVHHQNLTILVGYCDEGDKLGLIYEYMANGDLETHLSDKNPKFLSWELRMEIALDAAQGLEYLHTGCRPPIIHRDVKSTNILLNDEYQAKLADFGLSKVFPTEGSTHVSTTFAGTPGYFDPEFNLNEKSDVFSFGVVLLEIITGRPPIARNQEKTHISQWVSGILKTKGDVREVVDPRLGRDYDLDSVWKAVEVAMECVSGASTARPTMNHVVIELKSCLEMAKARMNKGYNQRESNYNDSIEMSSLNIDTTGMAPVAR